MVCELCLNKSLFFKSSIGTHDKTVIFPQVLTDKLHFLLSGKVHGKLSYTQKSAC